MAGKHVTEANAATIAAMKALGLGYITATELPTTIADGVVLLYNGTMWRGLATGESSLPAGTPWPVKGYKEACFEYAVNTDDEILSNYSVIRDEETGLSLSYIEGSVLQMVGLNPLCLPKLEISGFGLDSTTSIIFGLTDFGEGIYCLFTHSIYVVAIHNVRTTIKIYPPPYI